MPTPKIAVITGVSREAGLGFETARQLKALGYAVIITARDLKAAQQLADRIGAVAHQLDVTSDESADRFAGELAREYGKVDALINNAGAFFDQGGQPLSTDMQYVRDALDTNLLGAWRMAKAFVPLLEKSEGGRIVNVSSGAGAFTDPVFGLANHQGIVPVYGITKLALNGLTVKLARQLQDTSIKVNSVCPGFVATYPGTEQWGARPVSEGARGIVWAATLPDDGPTGGFFRDGEALAW
ncbi:MAG: SDR family NAD(P)-dependent oxidoreductase [Lewinellaceae bacterium]|nr:SDR family NAD(P)-dependent oxidoreductase [Lewinella sp.]MCB9282236.1 SDR family NAD(P)-dependent oxidoreductase [Lewinellaceae bacterium]